MLSNQHTYPLHCAPSVQKEVMTACAREDMLLYHLRRSHRQARCAGCDETLHHGRRCDGRGLQRQVRRTRDAHPRYVPPGGPHVRRVVRVGDDHVGGACQVKERHRARGEEASVGPQVAGFRRQAQPRPVAERRGADRRDGGLDFCGAKGANKRISRRGAEVHPSKQVMGGCSSHKLAHTHRAASVATSSHGLDPPSP